MNHKCESVLTRNGSATYVSRPTRITKHENVKYMIAAERGVGVMMMDTSDVTEVSIPLILW